jgi:hypothetical protein
MPRRSPPPMPRPILGSFPSARGASSPQPCACVSREVSGRSPQPHEPDDPVDTRPAIVRRVWRSALYATGR